MTKKQMVDRLVDKANELAETNRLNFHEAKAIWNMCLNWNDEQYDESEQIFMCECFDDNDEVNGFYIEDGRWLFN